MMLDFAFTANQGLKNIVELGTYLGITSLHLANMANLRGGQFKSFDIAEHRDGFTREAWDRMPNMEIFFTNLLDDPPHPKVLDAVKMDKTMFFFDNGDKTHECNYYMQYLANTESMFCTHDWDLEVGLEGIQASLDKYGFELWADEQARMLGSHVRCFEKKRLTKTTP